MIEDSNRSMKRHRSITTFVRCTLALLALSTASGEGAVLPLPPDAGAVLDPFEVMQPVEGVLELEVPGIVRSDLVVQYVNDEPYLDLAEFCNLLKIRLTAHSDERTITGEFPRGRTFELSSSSDSARLDGVNVYFPRTATVFHDGNVFVEQSALRRLLGISGTYDRTRVRLIIHADDRLPVVWLARHRILYAAINRDADASGDNDGVRRHFLGPPVIDWQLGSRDIGAVANMSGTFNVSAPLLFGVGRARIATSYQGGRNGQFASSLRGAAWSLSLPESQWLRQLTLGTVSAAGHEVIGVALTNLPLTGHEPHALHDLDGVTEAGSIVELYSGGILMDVVETDSTGRYSFALPIYYGTSDRLLRFIGPHGDIESSSVRLQADRRMTPARTLRYSLTGGTTGQRGSIVSLCDSFPVIAHGQFSLGIFDRLTVGADAFMFAQSVNRVSLGSLVPSFNATAWLGDAGALHAQYWPIDRRLAGEFVLSMPSNLAFRLRMDTLHLENGYFHASAQASVPLPAVSLTLSAHARRDSTGWFGAVVPQIAGTTAGITWALSTVIRTNVTATATTAILDESYFALSSSPISWLTVGASGRYNHAAKRLDAHLSVRLRVLRNISVTLGYSRSTTTLVSPSVRIGIDVDVPMSRIMINGANAATGFTSDVQAQGSILFSGTDLLFSSMPMSGRAIIKVTGFHDRNRNGALDHDEELLSDAASRLTVAGRMVSGDDGVFASLPSFAPWQLSVDLYAFASRGLFPAQETFGGTTSPGGVSEILVPYSEGTDVEGICRMETVTSRPIRFDGMTVHLVRESDDIAYSTTVFSDGTYYFAGVVMGRYRVELDKPETDARGLVQFGASSEVVVDTDGAVAQTLLVRSKWDR